MTLMSTLVRQYKLILIDIRPPDRLSYHPGKGDVMTEFDHLHSLCLLIFNYVYSYTLLLYIWNVF